MRFLFLLATIVLFAACSDGVDAPDVSAIKVEVPVQRFEHDFLALDTNRLEAGLDALQQKYPDFLPDFLQGVMGISSPEDVPLQVKYFLSTSGPLLDSVHRILPNLDPEFAAFRKAFQYVKHYFPDYKSPQIITLVGPIDALATWNGTPTPNFIRPQYLALSLQFYLGKDFSLYSSSQYITSVAPHYRSRRFDRAYLVADGMRLVADALYADSSADRPLIEQMVERGKAWYLLQKFLPAAPDSIITGYTGAQLEWLANNEGNAWTHVNQSEADLFTVEPHVIQTYIGEAPFTQGMPEASPGNIGHWMGWRMVRQWADRNQGKSLKELLSTPARQIFEESRYRPK